MHQFTSRPALKAGSTWAALAPCIFLAVALSALVVGCSGASDADESTAAGGDADSAEASTAAPSRSSSGMPPLPNAASAEGDLPRTYEGFTLGDPPPGNAKKLDDAPPFYPAASQYLVRLSESPKTTVGLYVHDGAVFRIEWRIRDDSIDRDDVAEAFSERLGLPDEPSEYLPKKYVYWSDGLSEGNTTITVFRHDDSDWFRVAFEDTGRTAQLMQLGG